MVKKLESKTEQYSVQGLNGLRNKIDLDALYQRGNVWNYSQKALFINSIMTGIIPNNIVVNRKMHNNGIMVCMDGKQRLTTIFEFIDNKFPVLINNRVMFYDKINEDIDFDIMEKKLKGKKQKVLSDGDRCEFEVSSLAFSIYQNLTYEEESEIFQRMQHGSSLSTGEKILSIVKNRECALMLGALCDQQKKNLQKIYSIKQLRRDTHKDFVIKLMYMTHNKTHKPPSAGKQKDFLKCLSDPDTFKVLRTSSKFPLRDKIVKTMDFFFDKNLFNHTKVCKNFNCNYILVMIYCMFENCYNDYEKIVKNDKKCNSVLHTFQYVERQINKNKIKGKQSAKNYDKIYKMFWSRYKKFFAADDLEDLLSQTKNSNDSDSDSDSDSDDDSDDDFESCDSNNDSDDEPENTANKKKLKLIVKPNYRRIIKSSEKSTT